MYKSYVAEVYDDRRWGSELKEKSGGTVSRRIEPHNREKLSMEIVFKNSSEDSCPVYHRYHQQSEPQGAYVEVNIEDGTVDADWNGEVGNAVPCSIWHGRVLRFPISPYMTGRDISSLLHVLKKDIEVLIADTEVVWTGSNHVGRRGEEAEEAHERIERKCEETLTDGNYGNVYTARDFLIGGQNEEAVLLELIVEHKKDATSAYAALKDGACGQGIILIEKSEFMEWYEDSIEHIRSIYQDAGEATEDDV